VDADLMRAKMQLTIGGFVNETCSTNAACKNLAVCNILYVKRFYNEGQVYSATI
jgi:hypothetical protein